MNQGAINSRARIRDAFARHRKIPDLREDGLGKDLCKAATDGAQECIAGEHDPDGTPWPALSKAYEEWKSFHHPGLPMGVLHGILANPREVAGEVEVTSDRAIVTYGVSEVARDEAAKFQARRRFFGLTDESRARSRELTEARFHKSI